MDVTNGLNSNKGRVMRAVIFSGLFLLATGASAQSEAWDCQSGSDQSADNAVLLSLTVNDDGGTGEIFVVGTVYDTQFGIRGFDRWWSFSDGSGGSYTFRIEPNGEGYYNALLDGGAATSEQSYLCRQTQERQQATVREQGEEGGVGPEAAVETGLLNEYVRSVESQIYENWIRPGSAQAELECVVNLTLTSSGEVVAVLIRRCNGDDAIVGSIEAAVLRSSPLPLPIPSVFERNLEFLFSPDL